MLETKWKIIKADKYLIREIAGEMNMPVPCAAAFVHRGLDTIEKAEEFATLGMDKLHSPKDLPDIDKAVKRIKKAINLQEHIHVHGDYDVDGITSTAVMVTAFTQLNANFTYSVPHRILDGYDIKPATVIKAHENNVDLLISVDCGVVAFKTAEKAKELGIDLIITDHHMPKDDGSLPDCVAIVNANRLDSKYPFNGLAGVGVAVKTMMALMESMDEDPDAFLAEVLEYVALGTVADVAPMIDENRSLVAMGCDKLTNTNKVGVRELLKVAGVNSINTTSIGFFLGPRINAIGRLADASTALELLLEKNSSHASHLAKQLDATNRRRQEKQEQVTAEAEALLPKDIDEKHAIVVAAKSWHPGLVGLVAGKLAEKYGLPSLVCTVKPDGMAKGSCRSVKNFDILRALKSPGMGELFESLGGHEFAAGFELSADKIPLLLERLDEYAKNIGLQPAKIIEINSLVIDKDITTDTFNGIAKLAPFGSMNPEPIFLSRRIEVVEVSTVGAGGKHLKMKVKAGKWEKSWVQAIAWRRGDEMDLYPPGTLVDVVYKLSMEEFRGMTNLMMVIEDIRKSEEV